MSRLPRKDWKAVQPVWDAIAPIADNEHCYRLSDRTVAILLSQTEQLYWSTRWARDTPFTDEEKRQIRRWASDVEYQLTKPEDCVECDDRGCATYPLNGLKMEWLPSNPFTEPDGVPDGYGLPPWYIADGFSLIGAFPGDVVTDLVHLPTLTNPFFPFPRFRLTVQGAVRVQITFVNVYVGGIAQIQVDGMGTPEYMDLERDITEGESETEIIWEQDFNSSGEHFIDVLMLPVLNPDGFPLRFGGGVRKIVVCGADNLTICDDCPDCPEPDCEDCEDWLEDEFDLDEDDLEMLLDCYKHDVGDIKMNAGVAVGGSWLLCDGALYSKALYPDLALHLAGLTTETETEFAVPDMMLKSPMGLGANDDLVLMPLATAGEINHTLTTDEMPEHDHSFGDHTHQVGVHTHPGGSHSHVLGPHNHTTNPHRHTGADTIIDTKSDSAAGSTVRVMRSTGAGTNGTVTIPGGLTDLDTVVVNSTPEGQVTGVNSSNNTGNNTPFNTSAAGAGDSGDAGGGEAHNIVHPVIGVNFFIFAGCAMSESDCT